MHHLQLNCMYSPYREYYYTLCYIFIHWVCPLQLILFLPITKHITIIITFSSIILICFQLFHADSDELNKVLLLVLAQCLHCSSKYYNSHSVLYSICFVFNYQELNLVYMYGWRIFWRTWKCLILTLSFCKATIHVVTQFTISTH